MAFPVNGILDNFNSGASQNLTARTGWGTAPIKTGDASWQTDGTPTIARNNSSVASNYWNTSWQDVEAFFALPAFNSATSGIRVCARVSPGASPTYYAVDCGFASANDFQIIKVVSGTRTGIGTLQTQAVANGDSIGISCVGSTITSYYKSGAGAWTQKEAITDSSITASGFIGMAVQFGGVVNVDDFGGGLLVATVPDIVVPTIISPREPVPVAVGSRVISAFDNPPVVVPRQTAAWITRSGGN